MSEKTSKRQQKKQEEDFQNRAKQFMQEYKTIRARYQCDFQAGLRLINEGKGGIVPSIGVIDVTKAIEAEEKAEELKAEAMEKQRLEAEKNKENQNNEKKS